MARLLAVWLSVFGAMPRPLQAENHVGVGDTLVKVGYPTDVSIRIGTDSIADEGEGKAVVIPKGFGGKRDRWVDVPQQHRMR